MEYFLLYTSHFLFQILSVSSEQTVAIRTKSLRCLTMVVEADANVLARNDMQMWVQNSFLDQSTAVREAAVDLVGKYVLSCHDLIDKYYEMLSLRILVWSLYLSIVTNDQHEFI